MRLLFVSHSFPPAGRPLANVGGMQRVATELHEALSHHPDVDLSSRILRGSWRWTHFKVVPFLAHTMWKIDRMAARNEIDAVLFSSMVTAALCVPLQKRLRARGIRTAAITHGLDVTLPFAPYQRFLPHVFGALDALMPVSRATAAACLERGARAGQLFIVPNGVKLDRFDAPANRTAARRALVQNLGDDAADLPEDGLLLCSVGRQVKRKGFAWFVDHVLPLLPDDVHYWLAGEGPEADEIRAAAARHGLTSRVRLLGRVSEATLTSLYRGADLFVMPNIPVEGDMEGFGVVMLEAGLNGLPSVGARLEGIQDVIDEGANGHLIESQNPWAFSEAIMAYYYDRKALVSASKRAAAYVADTFSWDAVADQYVRALEDLVHPVPAPSTAVGW